MALRVRACGRVAGQNRADCMDKVILPRITNCFTAPALLQRTTALLARLAGSMLWIPHLRGMPAPLAWRLLRRLLMADAAAVLRETYGK